VAEHFDQAVNAEPIDLAPLEIADARLGGMEQLRRGRLGQPTGLDELRQSDHEADRAQLVPGKAARFGRKGAEVLQGDSTHTSGFSPMGGLYR
jgi:hypothetical protein